MKAVAPPPADVLALLGEGRTLVEARQADLDLDGAPEWILVARFLHPTRIDHGPRSAEWRAGERIESRLTHELVVVGRQRGAAAVRFSAELRGSERQALLVEPLASSTRTLGRRPVVITGARACGLGSCGPVELHVVAWDPGRRKLEGYAWADAELAVYTPAGAIEVWFADRRPGDPLCCPSGYSVMRLVQFGADVDVAEQRSVPADRQKRLLLPGGLILRGDALPPKRAPPAAAVAAPPAPPPPAPRPPVRRGNSVSFEPDPPAPPQAPAP